MPPANRLSPIALAETLNKQLNRLHTALDDLHRAASRANIVASRGSEKGRQVRDYLQSIEITLRRAHEREPGWKNAIEKANHFFVGGEPSKFELVKRDLKITEVAIYSLRDLVLGLEKTRSNIRSFRNQIGFFDASMMGFHMGAGEGIGIGPEEEVRVLGEVVEEFGRAIGRAKDRSLSADSGRLARIEA